MDDQQTDMDLDIVVRNIGEKHSCCEAENKFQIFDFSHWKTKVMPFCLPLVEAHKVVHIHQLIISIIRKT